MKTNKIIYVVLILFLLCIVQSCSDPPKERNGSDILEVIEPIFYSGNYLSIQEPKPEILTKYRIKTINVKAYTIENNKYIPSFRNYKLLEYNKAGYLTTQKTLDKKGKDKDIDEFEYKFEQEKVSKLIHKMPLRTGMTSKVFEFITEYTYDKNGNFIEVNTYQEGGNSLSKISDKKLISKAAYIRKDEEIEINTQQSLSLSDLLTEGSFIKIKVDDNNNPLELSVFNVGLKSPKEMTEKIRYVLTYNSENLLSNWELKTFGQFETKLTREYQYDDEGLATNILVQHQNKDKIISSKVDITYNEIGLPIETKTYDVNMNLVSTFKIEYNYFKD